MCLLAREQGELECAATDVDDKGQNEDCAADALRELAVCKADMQPGASS